MRPWRISSIRVQGWHSSVISTSARPSARRVPAGRLISLTPWYAGAHATEITAAVQAAQEQIRQKAIEADPWYRNQPPEPPF